jgi:ABC-type dipeptide/oligopeptide/nickel transport system ATPase component
MINIKLTPEQMDAYSTNTFSVPFPLNVFENSDTNLIKSINDITHTKTLINFMPKVLDVFNSLAKFKKPLGSLNIATIKGEMTFVLNLFRTKASASLFEVFSKLGINLHRIMIAYSPSKEVIEIDNSLYVNLTRLDQKYIEQITVYLMSLIQLFIRLTDYNLEDNHFATSKMSVNELRISKEIYESINDFLFDTSVNFNINLKELEYSTLDTLVIDNVSYAANMPLATTASSNPLQYVNLQKDNDYFILIKKSSGFYYLVNLQKGSVSTNINNLSYLDFDSDTSSVGIAGSLKGYPSKTITISKTTTDNLLNGTYNILENHYEIQDLHIKEKAETFINNMVVVRDFIEAPELQVIFDDLDKKHFNVESTSFVSIDSIKETYKDDKYAQQLYSSNEELMKRLGPVDLKDLSSMVPSIIKGDTYSAIFTGESGTGKSTTAKHLFYSSGIPFELINASINIEESDLIGIMVANKDRKSDLDPMFVWKDGILSRAVRNGYGVILEEINFARAGVLGKFNSLLDDSRQIELGDGTILKAHPNFRFFATGNIGEEGTQRLNRALINRFQHAKKFQHLNKNDTIELIMAKTGYKNRDNVEKVYVIYDAIKKYAKENQLKLSISIRQLLNIFNSPKVYKTVEQAVTNFMLNHAFLEEEEHQEHFTETVLSVMDLKFKL